MFRETHARSIMKAVSWRIMGTLATTGIVFAFTRRLSISLAVGSLEFLSKIGIFWLHERVWDRLPFGREQIQPVVLWLTGLSGSGKSSVADWVADALRHRGLRVERLDGDTIRDIFPTTGYSRPERDAHIKRVGYLASKLESNGVFVVASFVSPYRDARAFVRGLCTHFIEIHVATPLEVCERRDTKGLYARARRGELAQFTGVSDPYEAPSQADLVIDMSALSVESAGSRILALLDRPVGRRGVRFEPR